MEFAGVLVSHVQKDGCVSLVMEWKHPCTNKEMMPR